MLHEVLLTLTTFYLTWPIFSNPSETHIIILNVVVYE